MCLLDFKTHCQVPTYPPPLMMDQKEKRQENFPITYMVYYIKITFNVFFLWQRIFQCNHWTVTMTHMLLGLGGGGIREGSDWYGFCHYLKWWVCPWKKGHFLRLGIRNRCQTCYSLQPSPASSSSSSSLLSSHPLG